MDDLINILLGRNQDRKSDGLFGDLLGTLGKWIRTCGCLLVLVIIGGTAAILGGLVKLTNDQITMVIVFITMIVAIISLIRTGMGR